MQRLEGCGGKWAILGKGNKRCEGPKAGPCLLYSRLSREASVAELEGDGVTEVAGPGHIEPPEWHFWLFF